MDRIGMSHPSCQLIIICSDHLINTKLVNEGGRNEIELLAWRYVETNNNNNNLGVERTLLLSATTRRAEDAAGDRLQSPSWRSVLRSSLLSVVGRKPDDDAADSAGGWVLLLLSMDDDEGDRPPASSSCLHPAICCLQVCIHCVIYVTQQLVLVRNGSESGGANDLASADSSNWSGREKERESRPDRRRDVCVYIWVALAMWAVTAEWLTTKAKGL